LHTSNSAGILVAVKARYEIDLTVKELLQLGLGVEGRYVLARVEGTAFNPDLDEKACRRTVGAVDSVVGSVLRLRDAPDLAEVEADAAWLESRRDNFGDVLAVLTDGHHGLIRDRLDEAAYELLGAPGRLAKMTSLANRLSANGPLAIADGVLVDIGAPLGSASPGTGVPRVRSTRFDPPTFVFDPAGDKTNP
jgi:hypothetical protein